MRKKRHILRRMLFLIVLAAALGLAYVYLAPLMSTVEVASYADYTVRRGSIATDASFSATISVSSSESHQNTSRATAIREIYVENGQEVKKGDKLMQLDNGEVLKAGLDGVVTEMRFDTTDWLWSNVQLIQISDLTNLKVSLSIDEYDVRNVVAGQKCIVTIVPLGMEFETVISHVDRVSASSGQVAYYTATAELTVPSSVLPGMTASVTIPSETAQDVLLLDMAALAFDEEKQPYVLRREGDGYARVPVTTGLSDGMQVEILSGLSEGETVWAVSGTQTIENSFSLTEIYKKLVGENIVINDMTGSGGRGNIRTMPSQDETRTAPQGMSTFDANGGERVPGMPAENASQPQGEQLEADPDSEQEKQQPDQISTDSGQEAAATEAPARREKERKETQ